MIKDKELFGDGSVFGSDINKLSSGMPGLKNSSKMNSKKSKQNSMMSKQNSGFIDKELMIDNNADQDNDDKLTEMNQNSVNIGSNLAKNNKDIYGNEDVWEQ